MRTLNGLAAAALIVAAAPTVIPTQASAQPPGAPRGSYLAHCSDIRMNGLFLSAVCRGIHGGGQSSINVASCSGDIGVDATGALSCAGPGAAQPPPVIGYDTAPRQPYGPAPYRGRGREPDRGYRDAREALNLYPGRDFRGPPTHIEGPAPNLAGLGMNDRVRSIELDRESGPWLVCADAGFRGRCATIERSVADTARLGLSGGISSLRPLR
jgi:hypothetical protein